MLDGQADDDCEVMRVMHSFGMNKFAAAVMWVLH